MDDNIQNMQDKQFVASVALMNHWHIPNNCKMKLSTSLVKQNCLPLYFHPTTSWWITEMHVFSTTFPHLWTFWQLSKWLFSMPVVMTKNLTTFLTVFTDQHCRNTYLKQRETKSKWTRSNMYSHLLTDLVALVGYGCNLIYTQDFIDCKSTWHWFRNWLGVIRPMSTKICDVIKWHEISIPLTSILLKQGA